MAFRGVGLALTIALVAGCDPAQATDASAHPDWSKASGVSANCDDGFTAKYDPLGQYDIDHDTDQDWFVRLSCVNGPYVVGDQVEVFDGNPGDGHPRRLSAHPLIHQARGIKVRCVEFHENTVYIADMSGSTLPGMSPATPRGGPRA